MKFSIVIPAYNEENAIASIIERCLAVLPDIVKNTGVDEAEILVVNDGSTDGTERIAKEYKDIKVISYKRNKGYGAALKNGIKLAGGEIVGFLDADGTCDPADFIHMLNSLKEHDADIVVGSRMNPESNMPGIRKLGNKLWVLLLTFISNKSLTDAASGIRIFKKSIFTKLLPLPDGLHFTPAMSTKAILEKDIKLIEAPVSYDERIGKSKLNVINDGVQFLKVILEISLTYKPIKIFGSFGIILLVIALAYSIAPIIYYLQTKTVQEGMIYRFLALFVFAIAGLNLFALGTIGHNIVCLIRGNEETVGKITAIINNISRPKWLLRFGFLFVLGGVVLNYKSIFQYISTGHIYMHWSYIVVGGGLVLSGFQFITIAVLQKLVETLKDIYRS